MLAPMHHGGGRRAIRVVLAVAVALVAVLVLAQLILPGIAARRISARIARYGHVDAVSVSAWPALKLLWGQADTVSVKAGALALTPAQASALLWESRGVSRMRLSASSVRLGPLELEGVSLQKRGGQLAGAATTSAAQAAAALPAGVSATLIASREGAVEVQATGGLFGVSASVRARAEAREGDLIAHPVGFLIEGFQLTLFADPHVHIESVGASVRSQEPLTYRLTIEALLG